MSNKKNLNYLNKKVSCKLLDAIRLVEILEKLNDGETQEDILISILKYKIKTAFKDIEDCRRMI
ncbi:MAG: hypothetical protein ACI37T_05870 [Candidatus Gastranaerophilaceae bacterium]